MQIMCHNEQLSAAVGVHGILFKVPESSMSPHKNWVSKAYYK